MSVSCECRVFSGRGLCDRPIVAHTSRTKCSVPEFNLETSTMRSVRFTKAVEPLTNYRLKQLKYR